MSNINPPFQDLSLDPAEVIVVNEASTWRARHFTTSGSLKWIVKSLPEEFCRPKTGERDASKLCERAIHGLTAFDYRQHGS
jgi:hypothetical protein